MTKLIKSQAGVHQQQLLLQADRAEFEKRMRQKEDELAQIEASIEEEKLKDTDLTERYRAALHLIPSQKERHAVKVVKQEEQELEREANLVMEKLKKERDRLRVAMKRQEREFEKCVKGNSEMAVKVEDIHEKLDSARKFGDVTKAKKVKETAREMKEAIQKRKGGRDKRVVKCWE